MPQDATGCHRFPDLEFPEPLKSMKIYENLWKSMQIYENL